MKNTFTAIFAALLLLCACACVHAVRGYTELKLKELRTKQHACNCAQLCHTMKCPCASAGRACQQADPEHGIAGCLCGVDLCQEGKKLEGQKVARDMSAEAVARRKVKRQRRLQRAQRPQQQ